MSAILYSTFLLKLLLLLFSSSPVVSSRVTGVLGGLVLSAGGGLLLLFLSASDTLFLEGLFFLLLGIDSLCCLIFCCLLFDVVLICFSFSSFSCLVIIIHSCSSLFILIRKPSIRDTSDFFILGTKSVIQVSLYFIVSSVGSDSSFFCSCFFSFNSPFSFPSTSCRIFFYLIKFSPDAFDLILCDCTVWVFCIFFLTSRINFYILD